MNLETAIFGGGCFWCTEAVFQRLNGVVKVEPGYAGGTTVNPSYEDVCSGATGHAEVIRISYDPRRISYHELLEVFFALHDPTTLNQQGNDRGTQYRSIILATTSQQHEEAARYITQLTQDNKFAQPIVTEIKPFESFYPAEDYHQNYFNTHGSQPYCQIIIEPKIKKLLRQFPEKSAA